jgi:hypothetical protein
VDATLVLWLALVALAVLALRIPTCCEHHERPCQVCRREAALRREQSLVAGHVAGLHRGWRVDDCPMCREDGDDDA